MWSHARYVDLANYVPDDVEQNDKAVHKSPNSQARDHWI